MATLVRLVGAAAGRALHEHARGQAPPRTVQTGPTTKSLAADRAFERDVLDPGEHGRAVLDRAEEAAARPRNGQQAAGGLFLSVRYADRTSSTRSRTLPAATARTRQLTATPYELYDRVGLQRARLRGISLRPQHLRPAARATEQFTLEPTTTTRVPSKRSTTAPEPVTAPAHSGPPPSHPAAFAERDCNLSSCRYRAVPGTAAACGPWPWPAISAVTTSRAGHGLSVPTFRAPQRRYRGGTCQRHPRSPG
ncbi:DinB/UmuC family translesion DNA polymerase [Streptomyces xanthophaeus]|uniref:DinB/UmuC family translesion DNA polymerase n=1 Tax=Streptomyces xanthophaeus TaxID=67385 RepID=UPI00364AADDE